VEDQTKHSERDEQGIRSSGQTACHPHGKPKQKLQKQVISKIRQRGFAARGERVLGQTTGLKRLGCGLNYPPLLDKRVANGLFYLNLCFYVVLWIATLARFVIYRQAFLLDVIGHLRGPGFFTLPAGSSVLGSQFTALTVKEDKPSLDKGITGGWLLAVVATQSIAVLSALIAVDMPQPYKLGVNFLALSMWLWGGMLYIWMMSLIFYRYIFLSWLGPLRFLGLYERSDGRSCTSDFMRRIWCFSGHAFLHAQTVEQDTEAAK